MPTPEKIQCEKCGGVRNFRNPCCPNERMRRTRIKRGGKAEGEKLDELIAVLHKTTRETCRFCGKVRNKFRPCCQQERTRRWIIRQNKECEPEHHRCVDCGKVSENYRCKACTIRHRKKHGIPIRGGDAFE